MLHDGYTATQVAGVLGTLGAGESGLNPANFNPAGGGLGSFGIAQWRGPRQEALNTFASSRNLDPKDADTQAQFLIDELHGTLSSAGGDLRKANTVGDAARIWMNEYEKPGLDYSGKTIAAGSRALPSVLEYARQLNASAASGAAGATNPTAIPTTQAGPGFLKLPDYDKGAPIPTGTGGDGVTQADRDAFARAHEADLSPWKEFAKHAGGEAAAGMASLAGIPGDLMDVGNYITGGLLYKPLGWTSPDQVVGAPKSYLSLNNDKFEKAPAGSPGNPANSAHLADATNSVLGYDPSAPTNTMGTIGKWVGMIAPFAMGGAIGDLAEASRVTKAATEAAELSRTAAAPAEAGGVAGGVAGGAARGAAEGAANETAGGATGGAASPAGSPGLTVTEAPGQAVAEPTAAASRAAARMTPEQAAQIQGNPAWHLFDKAVLEPIAQGVGLGDAQTAIKDWTGSDQVAQTAMLPLALLMNTRIPVFTNLTEQAGNILYKSGQAARRMLGGGGAGEFDPAAISAMTPSQARDVFGQSIASATSEALDNAKAQIANISMPRSPTLSTLDTSNPAAWNTAASDLFTTAVNGTYNAAKMNERALWGGVDRTAARDFTAPVALKDQLAANFRNEVATLNRQPTDFPSKILDQVFAKPGGGSDAPGPQMVRTGVLDAQGNPVMRAVSDTTGPGLPRGLQPMDNLGAGQNTRSALEGEIRKLEMDPSIPGRRSQIGYLQQISNSLLDAMTQGDPGANPDAFRTAMNYSRALNAFRQTPEVAGVLAKSATGADQVNSALALDRFLKAGQAGTSGIRTLATAAQQLGGGEGAIGMVKDALRQKFAQEVAPHGYVSPEAAAQFMGPRKFGPMLAQPQFADVLADMKSAVKGEGQVGNVLGLGTNRTPGFGNTAGNADARRAATDLWLDNPVDQVMKALKGAPNQASAGERVLSQLARDPTGMATKGFIRVVSEDAFANGPAGLAKWADGNRGIVQAIGKVDPGFPQRLNALANPTKGPGLIATAADLGARVLGSRLGEKLAGGTGSELVLASAGSRIARQFLGQLSPSGALDVGAKVLAEPQAFDALNKGFRGSMPHLRILSAWLGSSPAAVVLNNLITQQQQTTGPTPARPQGLPQGTLGPLYTP
jgi:hypothetical protein